MFIDEPARVPPALCNGETTRTESSLDGVAGGITAEDATLPRADRRRAPRAKGGAL
jgi:hypothetical protein